MRPWSRAPERPWRGPRDRLERFRRLDTRRVPSPCFVVDRAAVEENLELLAGVARASGATVLAALKAFSMWRLGPLVGRYLSGTCASGLHEARLGREEYGGEVHTFCTAFGEADLAEVLEISDHVVFNSHAQWDRFRERSLAAQRRRPGLRFGLRVNPEHSEGTVALYDPCAPGSRLGIPRAQFDPERLAGISGLHFHTLCEQDFPPLERTLAAFEEKFGDALDRMEWVNFGGGHHITRFDYQLEALIECVRSFRERRGLAVYLEPGEAIAYHAGVLVAEVLDLPASDLPLAILDTSATCHVPDTLEMPYRAQILDAAEPGARAHTYRLGGLTCLAGDVIGDYSFDRPLEVGRRLVFEDMAYYTMVKTTTFNGVRLPAIALWDSRDDALELVRTFGYEDFRGRLS